MRLLVVEDEKRIADFLARGLQGAGYAVDVAPNGMTALDFIHATDYDLVILDIMLPDLDGLTILEKILGRKRVLVKENERAVALYKGEVLKILGPGEHLLPNRRDRSGVTDRALIESEIAKALAGEDYS